MAEGEREKIVRISELAAEQEDWELEAEEKTKEDWGFENYCSWVEGYRDQPIYACATCAAVVKRPVGVCYGCYLSCHLQHETYELFDRRDFRCDCGTQDLSQCTLSKHDARLGTNNDRNMYARNFDGKFCWCKEGYDDEEAPTMLQCRGSCQDWYHLTCINQKLKLDGRAPLPDPPEPDFVCNTCILSDAALLCEYPDCIAAPPPLSPPEPLGAMPTRPGTPIKSSSSQLFSTSRTAAKPPSPSPLRDGKYEGDATAIPTRSTPCRRVQMLHSVVEDGDIGKRAGARCQECEFDLAKYGASAVRVQEFDVWYCVPCFLGAERANLGNVGVLRGPKRGEGVTQAGLFLVPRWKSALCRCVSCTDDMAAASVSYLLREGGNRVVGPEKPPVSAPPTLAAGDTALLQAAGGDHARKLQILERYMEFQNSLKEYLSKLAEQHTVVTKEHVDEFVAAFQTENARKRRRIG